MALAVSFGAGRIVPELAGRTTWPYAVVGAGFGLPGLASIAFALGGSLSPRPRLENRIGPVRRAPIL
jgi:hypothetical protein